MLNLDTYKELARVENISESHYESLPSKVNQVGDRFWIYEVSSDTVNISPVIDWHEWLEQSELPFEFLVPCQELALLEICGYTNPTTGRIKLGSRNAGSRVKKVVNLLSVFHKKAKNISDWINFTFNDIQETLIEELDKDRREKLGDPSIASNAGYTSFSQHVSLLKLYTTLEGRSLCPFSVYELMLLTDTKQLLENYLSKIDLTFSQISIGTKGKAIPNHISMRWIVFMLSEFESDAFKFHRLFWLLRRKNNLPNKVRSIIKRFETLKRFEGGRTREKRGRRVDDMKQLIKSYRENCMRCFGEIKDIKLFIDFMSASYQKREDIESFTSRYVSHVYAAILLTNGPRKSEVNKLGLSNFKKVKDKVSNYNSFIHKTMKGVETIRSISGYVHDMANAIADLGMHDRYSENVSLFYAKKSSASLKTYSNFYKYFNSSYQAFIDSLDPEDAALVKDEMPNVHTHQGRHSFFGFALRIGDHDTHEQIRKHARHEYLSWMTNHYTEAKIRDIEKISAEREFISELVGKIVSKKDHGLIGPTLKTLESLIEEHIDFYDTNSKEEMAELGSVIADEFDQITINQFGLCIPRIKTLHKSKCWSKSTKTPNYESGSTFTNCSGCLHFCGMQGHLEDIERIAIQISTTLEATPIISPSMKKLLEQELKRAERLLSEGEKNEG